MSTNIDQPFQPDEKLLQELANRLFRENESYSPLPIIGQYAPVNESPTDPRNSSFETIPHGIPQPHFTSFGIPASAGGAGISSGALNPINEIDLRNRNELVTDKQNTDTNQLPKSVAGSGISPSAHHQGNEVDLADPQTSLPDPHFPEDSKVPSSVAGSGISPSVNYLEHNNKLSNTSEEHLPPDIKTILESILLFDSGPQLPFNPNQVQNEDYYFLQQPAEIFGRTKDQGAVKPVGKSGLVKPSFEVDTIKKDFPILQERVNGRQIVWLDNAATTQKPRQVIDRISYFYEHENSNVHRAAHELAARATDAYEGARELSLIHI